MTKQLQISLASEQLCEEDPKDFVSGGRENDPNATTCISGQQWANVYNGMAFALRQGIVMNVHVTIV